jgi:predicted kinase
MTPPHTLHLLCGKAGAGKSTLAQSLAAQHQAVLISEDVWLARLFPGELHTLDDYIRCSRRIKAVVGPMVLALLPRQSVVLDFPANTVDTRRWFRALLDLAQVPHTLHHVDASDAHCLGQIAQRNEARPEGSHVISEAMFHHLTSFFQPPTEAEGFQVQVHCIPATPDDTPS